MTDHALRAELFEARRGRLRVVAYRMLGSLSEADDAVQGAWRRIVEIDILGDSERLAGLGL